jgi:hypothetical protein
MALQPLPVNASHQHAQLPTQTAQDQQEGPAYADEFTVPESFSSMASQTGTTSPLDQFHFDQLQLDSSTGQTPDFSQVSNDSQIVSFASVEPASLEPIWAHLPALPQSMHAQNTSVSSARQIPLLQQMPQQSAPVASTMQIPMLQQSSLLASLAQMPMLLQSESFQMPGQMPGLSQDGQGSPLVPLGQLGQILMGLPTRNQAVPVASVLPAGQMSLISQMSKFAQLGSMVMNQQPGALPSFAHAALGLMGSSVPSMGNSMGNLPMNQLGQLGQQLMTNIVPRQNPLSDLLGAGLGESLPTMNPSPFDFAGTF